MAAHAADLPHSLTSAVFIRSAFEAFDPRIGAVGGRVSRPPGTGGPSGAVELIASLEADAE